jgi:hypothetical protein
MAAVSTLIERLQIVMAAKGWKHGDLVSITGMSSSVVSQWLGHGSKTIKTIGKMEAALKLQAASGFSALWIAKGAGPRHAPPSSPPAHAPTAKEPAGRYHHGVVEAIHVIAAALSSASPTTRAAAASLLSSLAQRPDEADVIGLQMTALVESGKQPAASRRSA